MTSPAAHQRYLLSDYLRLEAYSNVRHEFIDGHIYAMAGGTPEHGTYAANVIAILSGVLTGKRCRIQTSDVRIRVRATGLDTYPDVSVICGHEERDSDDPNALVNPILLVEITSPSTDEYDRGEKLEHYKKIPSLREVVFVAHDQHRIDVVRRQEDGIWTTTTASTGDAVMIESVAGELRVEDVYRDALARG